MNYYELFDSFTRQIIEEKENRILESITGVFCSEGYRVNKEDVKEIFEKAEAYDQLGKTQEIVSFKGVFTNYGKKNRELENELNHIKGTLRELLGETE